MTLTVVRAVVIVACVAIPLRASAQIDDATRAEAETYMRDGVAAARATHWEDAYAAFREAYERVPTNRVLMNLAGAQRQTGRWADAARSYRRWLSDATEADEPFRAGMAEALTEIEQDLGHATIDARGARSTDVVTVDDNPVERGAPVELDPGHHTVRLMRDSTVLRETTVEINAGDSQVVSLVAGPAEAASTSVAVDTTPWRSRPRPRRQDVWSTPWPWVGICAGVVVIGIVIAIAVVASQGPALPDVGNVGVFTL